MSGDKTVCDRVAGRSARRLEPGKTHGEWCLREVNSRERGWPEESGAAEGEVYGGGGVARERRVKLNLGLLGI